MVICDAIHRDPATGKFTLLGTFSVVGAPEFPTQHPLLAVYLALTDGRGVTPIKVELLATDKEDDILATAEVTADFSDPRMVVEAVLAFQGLVFPKPGEYRFVLYGAGEFMMERRLVVVSLKKGGPENG